MVLFLFEDGAHGKPAMKEEGLDTAVMAFHHMIALPERLTVVKGGLSLLGIVRHHHLQVQQRHVLLGGSLHHTDAPVDIGRIAVLHIVGCGDSEVGAGIEGLMADEHALAEGFPCEILGTISVSP